MAFRIRPYQPSDLETLRALVRHPSLAVEFDLLQHPGQLEEALDDPFHDAGSDRVGFHQGEPAGFSSAYVLPSAGGSWALVRVGVKAVFRRRGLGSSLLEATVSSLVSRAAKTGLEEVCVTGWLPSPCAEGFAARHGFRHARYFWLMERPHAPVPAVEWPPGIDVRTFDGSDAACLDWDRVYNESFAEHYHHVVSNADHCRAEARRPRFRPDGLALAYRDGRCVGFCRNVIDPGRGEVATLGVGPAARGIGLGRALLRWGVAWLERQGAARVVLMVDGENETALQLYRSEGFVTARTREIWGRPVP